MCSFGMRLVRKCDVSCGVKVVFYMWLVSSRFDCVCVVVMYMSWCFLVSLCLLLCCLNVLSLVSSVFWLMVVFYCMFGRFELLLCRVCGILLRLES